MEATQNPAETAETTEAPKVELLPEFKVDEFLRAVACAVNPKDSRRVLHGVHMKGSQATATDGHILLRCHLEDTNNNESGIPETVVPLAAFAKGTRFGSVDSGGIQVADADGIRTMLPIEGRYPDADACLPKGKAKVEFTMSVDVLASLVAAMKKAGTERVLFEFVKQNAPIRVSLGHPSTVVSGIVMPMKTRTR